MEFLKAQLSRIAEQLGGLTATQKMLTACLVAIMIMTMVWWSHYAATPEMDPLLNQSLSQDEIGMITANLDAKGIPEQVVGDKVLVPADRKTEALAGLAYSQALPKNFDNAFDDLVKQSTGPFTSPDVTDRMFLQAKERELSAIVSNIPGISNAQVLIDPTDQHRYDRPSIEPSAMVTITTMHSAENLRKMAESAAALVSGAQAGLSRSRINIVIDGQPMRVQDPSLSSAGVSDDEVVDLQRSHEEYLKGKIRDALGDISGLMISVSVKLDIADTQTNTYSVSNDPKQSISLPQTTDEQSSESTSAPPANQEAGASANIGISVASGGSSGANTTSNSKSTFLNDYSKKNESSHKGPGDAVPTAASVRVPHSYFVQAYKNQTGKDGDETSIDTFETAQLKIIQSTAAVAAQLPNPDQVVVSSYMDAAPVEASAASSVGSAPLSMVNGHIKELGVGALAAMSMFMMFMMVKKGAPAPVVAAPQSEEGPQTLPSDQIVAGQVTEGNALLDGMEMDEDSVKAQQMLDQVQQMVQTNPDGAASLVKRWLNRS